ncbi:ferrichrome ABC transporter ATP-binding protein [Methanosarcina mazei]|uniref:Cobalamin import ATP-binding protein BtuD n=1 Tax=Methanosarcina mazei TaxID=2209 RepID=A0A0F8ECU8_METMZ|nr:ABC transporter ATP-binding protein [Methanosarcina mazei]KKG05830.1 ferrichrome ABC transporter ATP-binding protein [Methanosarcina mazei]
MKLEIKNLKFRYNSNPVLKNVSMISEPMVTAIIGPNAAGKSTLLKCMCGILKAEGSIILNGKDLKAYQKDEVIKAISYLPQESSTNAIMTVLEATLLGKISSLGWRIKDEDLSASMDTLEKLGIEDLAMRQMNELSGGQKQMVSIAQSIIRNPGVLLMDEPTNSLDLQRQLELFDVIRDITDENKMTTIVALHDLNLAARYAGKVILMNGGKIMAAGSPASVITEAMIREVYGVNARVTLDDEGIPQVIPINSTRKCGIKRP